MNPFLLDSGTRLAHWKTFRKGLVDKNLTTQVNAVANYWSKAPLGVCAYDMDSCSHWPNPWELIHNNRWCRSSVAIGMENTLRLAGLADDRLTLQLITDDLYQALLVLIIDDTYVLNYAWGSVHLIPFSDHEVIRQWRFTDRGFFQLDI
jgi:hypothetical protein